MSGWRGSAKDLSILVFLDGDVVLGSRPAAGLDERLRFRGLIGLTNSDVVVMPAPWVEMGFVNDGAVSDG